MDDPKKNQIPVVFKILYGLNASCICLMPIMFAVWQRRGIENVRFYLV